MNIIVSKIKNSKSTHPKSLLKNEGKITESSIELLDQPRFGERGDMDSMSPLSPNYVGDSFEESKSHQQVGFFNGINDNVNNIANTQITVSEIPKTIKITHKGKKDNKYKCINKGIENNTQLQPKKSITDNSHMNDVESIHTNDTIKKAKPTKTFTQKCKTQKRKISKKDKLHMWDSFYKDIIDITNDNTQGDNDIDVSHIVMKTATSTGRNTKKERKEDSVITLEEIDENPNHKCKLCSSSLIIMDDGFPTCSNPSCGVMNRDILDYSPEWRFYGADDKNANDPTRCGNPINPLLVESSFGCKLICSSRSSYEMRRIRQWVEWTAMPHKEKSMYEEFQFISVMARNSGIPKIFIDDAMVIHKDISSQKMFRGLNRDGIKSASIYISCRLNGSPRTPQEIATIFHLDKDSASKGCSMAVNILNNIYRNNEPTQKSELCNTKPSLFIERFCSKLNINAELTMLSKFIAKKIEENDIICDNTPHSIAAGIIYFINVHGHLNLSKTQIKHICGVSEVTIGKCFKKLEAIKEQFLPKCIMERYSKNE